MRSAAALAVTCAAFMFFFGLAYLLAPPDRWEPTSRVAAPAAPAPALAAVALPDLEHAPERRAPAREKRPARDISERPAVRPRPAAESRSVLVAPQAPARTPAATATPLPVAPPTPPVRPAPPTAPVRPAPPPPPPPVRSESDTRATPEPTFDDGGKPNSGEFDYEDGGP